MESLIRFLHRFGRVNAEEAELINRCTTEINVEKGGYFSEAGKIPNRVGFLLSGVMRVCYYSRAGDEFTRCFVLENNFVVDYNCFVNEIACAEYVEALTPCCLLVFSKEDFIGMNTSVSDWSLMITKIMSAATMKKVAEARQMLNEDGKTRYLHFLDNYPGLANRIPLSAIASYLGVTQSSLSRIRKAL